MFIVSDNHNCPFNMSLSASSARSRSVYCPETVCPAVFIVSEGDAADLVQESLGCFNYEGFNVKYFYKFEISI